MADPMKDLTNIYTLRDRSLNLDKCVEKRKKHIQTLNEEATPECERKLQKAMLMKMEIFQEFTEAILEGFSTMYAQDMTDKTKKHRLTSAKIAQMNKILAQLIAVCTVTHEEWNRKIADARTRVKDEPDGCVWTAVFGCAVGAVILGLMGGPCTVLAAIALLRGIAASLNLSQPEKTAVVTGAAVGGVVGGVAAASGGASLAVVGVVAGAGVGILVVCVGCAVYRHCKSPTDMEPSDEDTKIEPSEYAAMLKRIKSDLPEMDLDVVHSELTALMESM